MFWRYVTAPLGSNVTLECVVNQPILAWSINKLQLLDQTVINNLQENGYLVDISATERVPAGNKTTITIPATVLVNETVGNISCHAGPTPFHLTSAEIFTITVYG